MARKKANKKSSNSYWMKYGGTARKMHTGGSADNQWQGFDHPHPHPKNATVDELKGAQIWSTYSSDGDPLDKATEYGWENDEQKYIDAFRKTKWFNYFPDTLADVPTTIDDLRKYEEAINANKSKQIELYDTKFDDFSDLLYGTSTALRAAGTWLPAGTPQTTVGKGLLWLASMVPTGVKAGWDWHKRKWNTRMKEENPFATFVSEDGTILNYEDNEYSLFNSFRYPRGVTNVRTKPVDTKESDTKEEILNQGGTNQNVTDPLSNPDDYDKKNFGGMSGGGGMSPQTAIAGFQAIMDMAKPEDKYMGPVTTDASGNIIKTPSYHPNYNLRSQKNKKHTLTEMGGDPKKMVTDVVEDPTFKMWFAKNARRPDVIQSSGNTEQLKSLFLKDINFPGGNMPLFSGEMDPYGNIDKSGRSADISEKIIGGMDFKPFDFPIKDGPTEPKDKQKFFDYRKYGGGLPKAELGMGQGLYESPTDYIRDYANKEDRKRNFNQKLGKAGDSNFAQIFNVAMPGLGTIIDAGLDIFGFYGDKKQYKDLQHDALKSQNILRNLNREGVFKDTLDMSTRLDAVTAKSSHGMEKPNFFKDLAPELIGNVASLAGGQAAGIFGGGGAGAAGDIGDFVDPVNLAPGDALAKYGGKPKAKYGLNEPMLFDVAAKDGQVVDTPYKKGRTFRYERDRKKWQEEQKRIAAELALNKKAMGGANLFQPGLTNSMISGTMNPLSAEQQFKSTGMEQQFDQGGQGTTQDYEAEGGEVIMHESGNVPATTGGTEQIDGGMDDAMLSLLQGQSHDNGGEIVKGDDQQYVFSKSLKSKVWNTNFAEAAEKIGNNISRFKQEAEDGDAITKSTAMSMIDAWNKKLSDLQVEQESARKEKFMEMVNSGADPKQLEESFPDLFQQFMAEQQEQQLSGTAGGEIEQFAGMAANPMGDIDVSQLSAQDQQLVGAKYGLPQMVNGGDFEPFDFNRYFGELQSDGLFENVDQGNFTLGKDYFPKRGELMDFLTMNYPDEGYTYGDQTYTSAKDMYKALQTGFSTRRGEHLEGLGISSTKPSQDDYMKDIEIMNPRTGEMETSWDWIDEDSKGKYTQDKAGWQLYNRGLPVGWDENYGHDVGMSRRKYFKNLETSLLADGKSKSEINSILEREKLKYNEYSSSLESKDEQPELSDEEKAAALLKKQQQAEKFKKGLTSALGNLQSLAPTLYNFMKGNEPAAQEQFVGNKNENQIKQNLRRLTNLDISPLLAENEQNFNMLKYLARDHAGGQLGSYLNTLIRGQNVQNIADAKAYDTKIKSDTLGLKIGNESLYNLGEQDRKEGVRVSEVNAMNKAAKQAFTAKGWEGLSKFGQTQELMNNQMNQDEQLKGLLNKIYPDAHLYMNRDGSMDYKKLFESGEMDKLMEKYPELKDHLLKYFEDND